MEPDGGEQERGGREAGEHADLDAARRGLAGHDVGQEPQVRDRLLGIGTAHDRAHRGHQGHGIAAGANGEVFRGVADDRLVRDLAVREIDLRLARALQPTRTSPTTPTIVRSAPPNWNTRPIGSWPGQCSVTSDSLTTATNGASAASETAMSRPCRSGTPSAAKKPGVT